MFRQPFRVLITEAFETGTKSVVCCPSLVVQQELFAKDPVHQFVALRRQTLTWEYTQGSVLLLLRNRWKSGEEVAMQGAMLMLP